MPYADVYAVHGPPNNLIEISAGMDCTLRFVQIQLSASSHAVLQKQYCPVATYCGGLDFPGADRKTLRCYSQDTIT